MFSWLKKLTDQLAKENEIKQDEEITQETGVISTEPELSEEEKSQIRMRKEKLLKDTAERVLKVINSEEKKFKKNFQTSTTLKVVKNEDGFPLAKEFTVDKDGEPTKISVNSVTDGVGGTGANLRHIPECDIYLTEAHLGAHEVQRIMSYHVENQQEFFSKSAEEIRDGLNANLMGVLRDLDVRYPTKFEIEENDYFFQTTFSMAIIQENSKSKTVQMIWAGDSPIIIITPQNIITSTDCDKPWDTPLYNFLSNKVVDLRQRTFISAPDEPLVVVACSDGMTKFRGVNSQLQTIVEGVLGSLKGATNYNDFNERLQSFYNQMPRYNDDTTLSISTSIKDEAGLEKLLNKSKVVVSLGD